MRAYYNEIDRFNCDLLQHLMDRELITPGRIDDRSIVDVRPDDVAGFERTHFFAGIGGWDLALNLAGWSGAVWTGSCPCQPFSIAGKQQGFDDDRHLWPIWRDNLVSVGRPPAIFGEQVASASAWLGLVRGDLEALEYAVGAMPIEAASAGSDHLRDRYWFVAYASRNNEQRRVWEPGSRSEPQVAAGGLRPTNELANADDVGSQGREVLPECPDQRTVGPNCMANGDGQHQRWRPSEESGPPRCAEGEVGEQDRQRDGLLDRGARESEFAWVLGADGKTRRVKPGIRLLADGVPGRVGLLRGFGNAIDPRPAAAFVEAAMNARSHLPQGRGPDHG